MTARTATLLQLAALTAYATLLLWGVSTWLDLPISDDSEYFEAAAKLAAGDTSLWTPIWSPIYVAAYAAIVALPLPGHPMDWMHVACALGGALALWWALRCQVPSWWALLAAAWWLLLDVPLRLPDRLFVFDMTLWTLAGGFFLRGRDLTALGFMLLGVVDRAETLLWLLALGVAVAIWHRRMQPTVAGRRYVFVAAGLLVAVLCSIDDRRSNRFWLTYQQHYALGVVDRAGADAIIDGVEVNGWHHTDLLFRRTFGDAASVHEAALVAPGEFAAHIGHNLLNLPKRAVHTFLKPLRRQKVVRYLLLLGLVVALWAGRKNLRGSALWTALPARGWILAASPLAPLVPILLLEPKSALLVPYSLPVFLLASTVLAPRAGGPSTGRATVLASLGIVVFAAIAPDGSARPDHILHRRAAALLADRGNGHDGALLARDADRLRQAALRFDLEPLELSRRATPGPRLTEEIEELVRERRPELVFVDSRDPNAASTVDATRAHAYTELGSDGPFTLFGRAP